MKWLVASFALMASTAHAAYYEVSVTGTLVSQINAGSDPKFAVGDTIVMTARFNTSKAVEWGAYGYKAAGLYGLPTQGIEFFKISAADSAWKSQDDWLDGGPVYFEFGYYSGKYFTFANPAIAFDANGVLGLSGYLSAVGNSALPGITLGSNIYGLNDDYPEYEQLYYSPPTELSASFEIWDPMCSYSNCYQSPGFKGVWDFEGSSVSFVPEPATWLSLIAGFGLVGTAMRRRMPRTSPTS